jgi:uncharacterized protein YkwD
MNVQGHLGALFLPTATNNYRPHALNSRHLSLYAALVVAVKLFSIAAIGLVPAGYASSDALTSSNIYELTNKSRIAYGVGTLSHSGMLDLAAQAKAEDMLKNQYFSHNSPGEITPWNFIKASGYNYIIAGENLALNFYSSEGVEKAWMNSPGHKANILNPDFEDIGIGIAKGEYRGVQAVFVVQMFGTSIDRPLATLDGYTLVAKKQLSPEIKLPNATKIALESPKTTAKDFSLIRNGTFTVEGSASGASKVYVLSDYKPVAVATVESGYFKTEVPLSEGLHNIAFISFDSNLQASKVSEEIRVKVDTEAPQISELNIQPVNSEGDYTVSARIQGEPVKVVAHVGSRNLILQKSVDSDIWQTTTKFMGSDLQGHYTVSASDLAGNVSSERGAELSVGTARNYGFLTVTGPGFVDLFGKTVSTAVFDQFFAGFLIVLVFAVAMAIAARRHAKHLGAIAQTSALLAFVLIVWMH